MKQEIIKSVEKALDNMGITGTVFKVDYPDNPEHGDFSCNVAMVCAKKAEVAPRELADKLVDALGQNKPDFVESITVAGPGFINFKVKDSAFVEAIVRGGATSGGGTSSSKRIMVEYTDPNPFKVFHIGHLMANAIGESISRLVESDGTSVVRACYQGDVGLHVAKTIWAIRKQDQRPDFPTVTDAVRWLGEMYVKGSQFDDDADIQKEIATINKKIFEKSDPEINEIYEQGRKWSLEYFDIIYERLGTKFDQFFFESEVAGDGIKVVHEFLKKGVFVESDGAVVFKGEDHGLHTRVFITSGGLPTYETKEIGLNIEKFRKYPDLDESIIITANEQNEYFKVLLKAFSLIDENIYAKTRHISHGIMRFASGKMSSRKGNIVSAEELIAAIREMVTEKMSDREGWSDGDRESIADIVAIGAIKYTVLRQAIGGDVVFDSAQSISFEGDSGPYLQYAAVRANSILEKSKAASYGAGDSNTMRCPDEATHLERLLSRFGDIVDRARAEHAPHHVAHYLMAVAGAFNGYYAAHQIIDAADPLSPYRIVLTRRFAETMTEGLRLLGIEVPSKM